MGKDVEASSGWFGNACVTVGQVRGTIIHIS